MNLLRFLLSLHPADDEADVKTSPKVEGGMDTQLPRGTVAHVGWAPNPRRSSFKKREGGENIFDVLRRDRSISINSYGKSIGRLPRGSVCTRSVPVAGLGPIPQTSYNFPSQFRLLLYELFFFFAPKLSERKSTYLVVGVPQ